MKRHQFMMDLLRPELAKENINQGIICRRELTVTDLDEIIKNAERVIEAAKNRRTVLTAN